MKKLKESRGEGSGRRGSGWWAQATSDQWKASCKNQRQVANRELKRPHAGFCLRTTLELRGRNSGKNFDVFTQESSRLYSKAKKGGEIFHKTSTF